MAFISKSCHQKMIIDNGFHQTMSLEADNLDCKKLMEQLQKVYQFKLLKMGEIDYLISKENWLKRKKDEMKEQMSSPIESTLITLNYVKAKTIQAMIKQDKLLSKEGTLHIDARTNTLFIQDHRYYLNQVKNWLLKIDIKKPQILIEVRVVNMDRNYEKELGVRFGVSHPSHLSGTLEGANALSKGVPIKDVDLSSRLNINMPAPSQAAKIGMSLFKLAKGTYLDLELSALESEGHAHIESMPRVVTSNQKKALIESGEEIPYQQSVAQGVTATSFKKAVLRLEVTPQLIPHQQIVLTLEVNQDKRGSKEVKGVPTIRMHHVTTEVTLEAGQTVVLGGISETITTQGEERVPFLGKLPGIGALFRHRKRGDIHRELLIFVTPWIIH